MNTKPLWQEVKSSMYPQVKKSQEYDVVVVGGGITGLTAAYLLKRAGKRVCLLERDFVGSADSGHTTAHLTYVTDLRLPKLVDAFGETDARLVWTGGQRAIDFIEQLGVSEGIECDFRRVEGYLIAAFQGTRDETYDLQGEQRLASKLGFSASFEPEIMQFHKPAVCFADQAKFHPLKYLGGLARCVNGDGSAIFEQSEVTAVEADPLTVVVNQQRLQCGYLVIATHVPLAGKAGLVNATLFQTKLSPCSTYVLGATHAPGALPEVSYWDTASPYHYLRVDHRADDDYVIFGGEDHKTGQATDTDTCYAKLEATLKQILPSANVDRRWSGQVIETHDGLPYIGEITSRQFVATGFAGNGMTFGTLAGMMACDAALGRSNPWEKLFSVSRKTLQSGWNFIVENLDYPYYLVKDRLAPAEGQSTEEVQRGEGKILSLDGKRVACSCDNQGKLTAVSAVCTHLGCLVHWNQAEKTWDCPCHGSRFQPTGEVISGPAESPLERVQHPDLNQNEQSNMKAAPQVGKSPKTPARKKAVSQKPSVNQQGEMDTPLRLIPKKKAGTKKPANGQTEKPKRRRSVAHEKDQ